MLIFLNGKGTILVIGCNILFKNTEYHLRSDLERKPKYEIYEKAVGTLGMKK